MAVRILIAFLLALVSSTSGELAKAQETHEYVVVGGGASQVALVDRRSINPSGKFVAVLELLVPLSPREVSGSQFADYALVLVTYDCSDKVVTEGSETSYGADGRAVAHDDVPVTRAVAPQSIAETTMMYVCGGKPPFPTDKVTSTIRGAVHYSRQLMRRFGTRNNIFAPPLHQI